MPHDVRTASEMIIEMFATGDVSKVDEVVHPDLVDHEVLPGIESQGRERFRQMVGLFAGAFSNLRIDVHDWIVDGDKVVTRSTMSGRHTGEFMGIPATNKDFSYEAIDIMRFAEGMCIEHWGISDQVTMMTQLGLMPG